jgi:glyoxylase-like metal-dependent hydrolase (beta-lactamase superfamily II)
MKNIEMMIIPCGHIENDAAWTFAGYNFATLSNKNCPSTWMKFPIFCVLVKHPDIGYILYDLGPGLGDDTTRRTPQMNDRYPLFIKRDEFIDENLKRLGLSVNDISAIVLSHTHWDHFGGIGFFSGTPAADHVYVPIKDFQAGLAETHSNPEGLSAAYVKQNYETPGITYTFLDEDMELAPGLKIIMLEGHTPALAALLVQTDSKNYLFATDAVYTRENYGPPIIQPGLVYDTLGTVRAVNKLRKIEKEYDAQLIFPHDSSDFATLNPAPYIYR